ncbi:membrane fusion protein (multidrug efflux system) [Paucimonas lemoignei]|uniref:Membrane fusion protein (Multidrug efflux system) n=1 Tax=Paucimonas lemoignei TaxID=29443 RepID=A0A4R3HSD8_PAULE|nr:HlyD family efflux transporter periplasmic adaptor subunit [Paucimonas lemoignei]TCS36057.1 membrane fusion protein (multidrug efflux system) [Paucimonas lemoignei]
MSDTPNMPAQAGAPAAAGNGSPKRKKILLTIAAIFILAGIGWGLYWFMYSRFYEETENAYVQGNVVQVTSQVAGTVTRIMADDTDIVKGGQQLISLDTADAEVAITQAEAQLAQTVREVRTLYASQAQSQANLRLRESELARVEDDLKRRKDLAGSGAVSAEEIRHAELAVKTAQAAVAAAREQLASGRALTEGTTPAEHPNVQRAAARLQEVMLAKARSTLYAPVGGEIAKRNAQVGQRITPGTPLMAIVPLDQLWVDANLKEAQLRHVRIGQPVKLVADLYGSKVEYDGKVAGLAAGTGSAFALLPAQNATGNWIKVVQRVPVRITLDPKQLQEHPLRVGLSMTVEIDVHDQSGEIIGSKSSHRTATSEDGVLKAAPAFLNSIDALAKSRSAAIIAANLK